MFCYKLRRTFSVNSSLSPPAVVFEESICHLFFFVRWEHRTPLEYRTPDPYSKGPGLFTAGELVKLLIYFVVLLSSSKQILGQYVKSSHYSFFYILSSSLFTITTSLKAINMQLFVIPVNRNIILGQRIKQSTADLPNGKLKREKIQFCISAVCTNKYKRIKFINTSENICKINF